MWFIIIISNLLINRVNAVSDEVYDCGDGTTELTEMICIDGKFNCNGRIQCNNRIEKRINISNPTRYFYNVFYNETKSIIISEMKILCLRLMYLS